MNKLKYIVLFLSLLLITGNVYAEEIDNSVKVGYKAVIEDEADLFSEEEENKLKDLMFSLTEFGNIIVKTISKNNYGSTDSYASNYYHKNFNSESGTLLLMDMDKRNVYIFSDGANYKVITKSKAYVITDNVYKYASSKNYYKCVEESLIEIKTLLNGGKILEPMRYICNAILSLTISSFLMFGIAMLFTKIKPVSHKSILNNCLINFKINGIEANKIGTHTVYSPRSDSGSFGGGSSGGGSSGGGSSGGGSSGGGGGHSF